jgi:hypothetical protein
MRYFKLNIILFFLYLFLLIGCKFAKNQEYLAQYGRDYVITTKDNYNKFRFDIEFESLSNKDICIYKDQWPDFDTYGQHRRYGEVIEQLEAKIIVNSKTRTYLPRPPTVSSHCQADDLRDMQNSCSQRLKQGQNIQTSLPYRFFDLEILKDNDKSKILDFKIVVEFCDVFSTG